MGVKINNRCFFFSYRIIVKGALPGFCRNFFLGAIQFGKFDGLVVNLGRFNQLNVESMPRLNGHSDVLIPIVTHLVYRLTLNTAKHGKEEELLTKRLLTQQGP